MEIQTHLSEDQTTLTLNLSGKFDYTCQEVFQQAYEAVDPSPQRYVIDALEVHSIDSSALGMLLLLRNHAGGDDANVAIINAKPDIHKLLQTCKFDELFDISPIG